MNQTTEIIVRVIYNYKNDYPLPEHDRKQRLLTQLSDKTYTFGSYVEQGRTGELVVVIEE